MRNKYPLVTVISWFLDFKLMSLQKIDFKYNFEIIELWPGQEAQRNHIYCFLFNFRIIFVSHCSLCKGSFQKAAPLEKGAFNRGKGHPQQCALCSNSDWAFF